LGRTIVDVSSLHVLIRVWLPDRPGALGLVASRIGSVDGDIVGIDVLEQGDGVAVDEFAVELRDPTAVPILVREIEEVDGVSVEQVRTVEHFPDPRLDALESAARLCAATTVTMLQETLVGEIRAEFLADWTALLTIGAVLASSGEPVPDPACSKCSIAGPPRRRSSRVAPPAPTISRSHHSWVTRPDSSSGATAIRSAGVSVPSSSRSRASPTARGRCSRDNAPTCVTSSGCI
jgi:hypothetical protein